MSSLEASITLEEIFGVLSSKRVPLAPELAGYLALELAEGAGIQPGEVDTKQVYVGDEGSVAIVRRPSQGEASPDSTTSKGAEASIRAILARLLEASGSQTPALSAVAKKKVPSGLPALVQELEAALIPVNRAAGRRALARLAREAKRVTLGVGRNAASGRHSSPSLPAGDARPPASSSFTQEEVPTTARREVPAEVMNAPSEPPPPVAKPMTGGGLVIKSSPVELQRPASVNELPTVALQREAPLPARARDSVDSLLSAFEVSNDADTLHSKELKAIAGLEPTPPPPGQAPEPISEPDTGLDSLLAMTDSVPPPKAHASPSARPASPPPASPPPTSLPPPSLPPKKESAPPPASPSIVEPAPMRKTAISYAEERSLPTEPRSVRNAGKKAKGRVIDKVLIAAFFLLLAGGAVMVWMLKPGFFTGRTPEKVEEEKRASEAASAKAAELAAKSHQCKESLQVTDVPPKAEVLLRIGQAPVDIPHMPVGQRLELVALLDGRASKRAVIGADQPWEKGADGKPRFEAPIQLDPLAKRHGKPVPDTWPSAEPGSDVAGAGKAEPGTLHIVSSPVNAEVWLVVGLGPEAQIDDIPCGDVDVMLGGPGTFKKRLHVRASDFVAGENAPNGDTVKTAKISGK